ncbi:MAG: TonB-dependent receptor [Muribaculaceae bacterium]|nr:TonB-dependent receptor [Muribaculaceae bacterium]
MNNFLNSVRRYLIFCLTVSLISITAKADFSVSGTILSAEDGEPCPGATYKIFNPTDTVYPLAFNVTDIDGKFNQKISETGDYILQVDYVGLKKRDIKFQITDQDPDINLGDVFLSQDGETLSEVVVTARKKLVQSDGATLTYNVEEDPEASINSTIEMLRKVPMVTVDADDNIKINGDSNFKILINGKEDPMLSGDVKTILKSMPAATIKKIEVITEPGAKYDAEGTGGILNIVTTGKQSLDGYLANISARVANNNFGGSFYGRGKINKVTASANINYVKSIDEGYTITGKTILENLTDDANRYQTSDSKMKNSFNYTGGNLNISWEPDSLNLITVQGNIGRTGFGQISHENVSMKTIEMIPVWELKRDNNSDYKNLWAGANASFQHTFHKTGHYLVTSYIFGYGKVNSDQTTFTFNDNGFPDDYPWRLQQSIGNDYRHTFQLDYVNPLSSTSTIEAGLKGNWRKNSSKDSPFYGDSEAGMVVAEREKIYVKQFQDIMAAYVSYTGNFGKWNTRAGLRYEYTRMGLDYEIGDFPNFTTKLNDVVPNLAISYKIQDASNLRLAYQMRISRPGISQLNPYMNTMEINKVSYGNPDLESEKSNSISLTYTNFGGKLGGSFGLSYDRVDNMITEYSFISNNILNSTYANIGHRQEFRGNLNLQWSVISMLNIGAYLSGRYTDLKADSPELKAKNHGWSGNFNLNADYTFPFKLRLSAYGGGGTGWINLQGKGGGFSYYGISFSRSFLKNDMMTLTASGSNFFTPYRSFTNTSKSETFYSSSDYRFKQWSVNIGISFKFGSLRTDVKRTGADIEMIEGSSSSSEDGNPRINGI